jgi:hypothetical protein
MIVPAEIFEEAIYYCCVAHQDNKFAHPTDKSINGFINELKVCDNTWKIAKGIFKEFKIKGEEDENEDEQSEILDDNPSIGIRSSH